MFKSGEGLKGEFSSPFLKMLVICSYFLVHLENKTFKSGQPYSYYQKTS